MFRCYIAFNKYHFFEMTYDAEFIEGTPIKTLWLEIQLSSKFKEHVKVQNVAPLGEEAVGYMSVIRKIFLSGSPQVPSTVIVKVKYLLFYLISL